MLGGEAQAPLALLVRKIGQPALHRGHGVVDHHSRGPPLGVAQEAASGRILGARIDLQDLHGAGVDERPHGHPPGSPRPGGPAPRPTARRGWGIACRASGSGPIPSRGSRSPPGPARPPRAPAAPPRRRWPPPSDPPAAGPGPARRDASGRRSAPESRRGRRGRSPGSWGRGAGPRPRPGRGRRSARRARRDSPPPSPEAPPDRTPRASG